jgi:Zn-finger nucleic acid-binding protein
MYSNGKCDTLASSFTNLKSKSMKCPSCNVDLVMSERQGVEIDYCPQCRGVWLDRGELDKIIDKSMDKSSQSVRKNFDNDRDQRDYQRDDDRNEPRNPRRKRDSFLGDLFDF